MPTGPLTIRDGRRSVRVVHRLTAVYGGNVAHTGATSPAQVLTVTR